MRYIIYGAGAVGSAVGASLYRSNHEVVLIARGAHYEAIGRSGLQVNGPQGTATYPIPVVDHPNKIRFGPNDAVMLTMKTQDTQYAINELAKNAPLTTSIICLQNGVENERIALRFFENVYGACVSCKTAFLQPGIVQATTAPQFGLLDIGRYPNGLDECTNEIAAALSKGWVIFQREHVMEWKYSKLLRNLVNAEEALCGARVTKGRFYDLVLAEGEAVLRAANIAYIDRVTWNDVRTLRPKELRTDDDSSFGGSTWQSLARQTGSIESAYLNGEIVLLARQHGIATPANALAYELTTRAAANSQPPGIMTKEELLSLLDDR